MNMRDSALDLMQVLQVAMSRYEDKLSREVSLELVEHFVEHNRRIDEILGYVQKPKDPSPKGEPVQLEAPQQPQLAAPEPVAEPVQEQAGDIIRDGRRGKMILQKAYTQTRNGRVVHMPEAWRFYAYPVIGDTVMSKDEKRRERDRERKRKVRQKKWETARVVASGKQDDIVTVNGVQGRLWPIKGWDIVKPDGTVYHRPDHTRFRPLEVKMPPNWRAPKHPVTVETPIDGGDGLPAFRPLQPPPKPKPEVETYPENDVVVNGVHGRMVRIPAHNKMNGTKFIMVPAKEVFRPWARKGGTTAWTATER